jgi:hypothetical protein
MSLPTNTYSSRRKREHTFAPAHVRLAVSILAAAVVLVVQGGAAYGNQMTVFSCHDPAGNGVGHTGWVIQRTGDMYMTAADTCGASGQGAMSLDLGANPSGYQNAARIEWFFQSPSWASIAKYYLAIPDSYAYVYTSGGEGQAEVWASDESDPVYDYRNYGGGSWGAGAINRTPPAPVSSINVNASCNGATGPCPANAQLAHLDLSYVTLLLNDTTTPTVAKVEGSLTTSAMLAGTAEISFNATDNGPGIYSAWLVVDGKAQPPVLVNSNNGLCKNLGQTKDGTRSFAEPEPCAKSTSGSVSLNTTGLPDGQHSVKLIVDDAAGNSTTAYVGTITTRNAQNGSLGALPGPGATTSLGVGGGAPNGTGASETARLQLGARSRVLRNYPKRALRVPGRLLNAQGLPIAGATLDVLQQVDGGSLELIGHGRTGTHGTFIARVPAGSSRTIQIAYRAFSADSNYAASAELHESVRAGVRLTVSPRRTGSEGTITLRGRVLGPVPPHGIVVELLVHYRGHWEPFRDPHTDGQGRFRVIYQFEGGIGRFPFRAEVPDGQTGFPFASGASRVVNVRTS